MGSRHADLLNGVEEWEFPLRRRDALNAAEDMPLGQVHGSRRGRPVPVGAVAELEEAIGKLLPFGPLVLPQTLRRQGHGRRICVCTPTQVLGVSAWGVAL
ncbi:hypothetical protein JL475_36250 [Streptomyces sp. M2CJ-2]|uniref:hypothetical protein n=1 Tax=Streptomyces sp. M2CJ-2 TaxID=2803948 RepID=UPI00192978F1|nr:hypothetical protein [Streptomyces sp. M2CJ-2]MBL3671274.1 hypothetical protein [Streptomyces sp. M2CJ-2]